MPGPRTRGQALTEFILVIPLFFLLLLGVVQLSMLGFARQVVHYAAFAATRAAIVRPCMAFHPDHAGQPHFTPTVFSAAVLATLAATPAQELFPLGAPYDWLPGLPPEIPEVQALDELGSAQTRYANAAYLTAVRRVVPDFNTEPVTWVPPDDPGPGGGPPCTPIPPAAPWVLIPGTAGPPGLCTRNPNPCGEWRESSYVASEPAQNVPPPTHDLTLEVTFLYPMRIPIVNRVFYGVFVNFGAEALPELEELDLTPITEPGGSIDDPDGPFGDVMTRPLRTLPAMLRYQLSVLQMVDAVMNTYDFSEASRLAVLPLTLGLLERQWYPLPIRARCTLTVEGALEPLVNFDPLFF